MLVDQNNFSLILNKCKEHIMTKASIVLNMYILFSDHFHFTDFFTWSFTMNRSITVCSFEGDETVY